MQNSRKPFACQPGDINHRPPTIEHRMAVCQNGPKVSPAYKNLNYSSHNQSKSNQIKVNQSKSKQTPASDCCFLSIYRSNHHSIRPVAIRAWAIMLVLFCALSVSSGARGQTVYENYTFLTLAGPGLSWFDGSGSAARFSIPAGIARDTNGNLYLADSGNNTIRKITPDGFVSTLAGLAGNSGTNDGTGAGARFNSPYDVAVGGDGTVYVADANNHVIRAISPTGVVSTLAGLAGTPGKVNGAGSAARFNSPRGIVVDSSNNVYVADTSNDAIRKITPAGVVSTFAGTLGSPGTNDATGTSAGFNLPIGLTMDGAGNLYVADFSNKAIRKITTNAVVSTLAGAPGSTNLVDGTNGTFGGPFGITMIGTNELYVTDESAETIREVTLDGVVTTIAGTISQSGYTNAVGTNALFNGPGGIVVDSQTNLFVCDSGNNNIREIAPDSAVTLFAGTPDGGPAANDDGVGNAARFSFPAAVAVDSFTNVYVSDHGNNSIRKITPDGVVTTLAGLSGSAGTNFDGTGTGARFNNPVGITVSSSGNLFVADNGNYSIREVTPLGVVTTLAGSGHFGTNNGIGTNASFNDPIGIAVDTNGNLFVGDSLNQVIREIAPDTTVSTFAGTMGDTGTNNAIGTNANFNFPEGVAFDSADNLYVVDEANSAIRKIAPDATVTTYAGVPGTKGSADGSASTAMFNSPAGVAVDVNGNVYVSDTDNDTIRKITPGGTVTTIAGSPGVTGNFDGTGSDAQFRFLEGMAVDAQGNVYVADANNNSIRKGSPAPPDVPVVDFAGAHTGVIRHFSISNETTTNWSWTFLRKPGGSSAQIVGATTDKPTFTPDVEDIYVIQFQGWDSSGRTVIRRLTLYADNTPPGLSITNPAPGFIASNGLFTVRGTATDNLGVSNVWVQFNGGAWTNASGKANWSKNLALVYTNVVGAAFTNVISAYAEDFAGNVSPTNQVLLPYFRSDRLHLRTFGGGSAKPDLDGVFLQISNTYSITAKAVPGSTFSNWMATIGTNAPFVFTNSPTISFVMQSNLTLVANFLDHQNPTLLITSPKSRQFASNALFTATGTAKDNDSVAAVYYQFNGGAWTNATGTNNWMAQLTLNPGTNTVLAYAQDPSGNVSTTNSAMLNYVPSARLSITGTGSGTLVPGYNGALLAIGTNYTITVKPATGYIFSNWVDHLGIVVSTNPGLTFTMQSNTAFTVNLTPNYHYFARGSYAGLFYDTNNLTATNAGFFSAVLTASNAFTAKVLLGGSTISASGQFSTDGVYSNAVPVKNSAPLVLQLQLDLTGQGRITGTVSGSGWTNAVVANQLVYSAANPPSQQFERFTLVLPGANDSSAQPGGNSYGNITINNLGTVTFAGVLADGSKVAQSTFISKDSEWPFYLSSANGLGVTIGWLTFGPGQGGSLNGHLYWERLPEAGALYPAGFSFTNGIDASGSFYTFYIGRRSLNFTNGMMVLQQADISPAITNYFTLNSNDSLTSTNQPKGSIAIITGIFKGTIVNPANSVSIPVNGVLLQGQTNGFGFFVNSNQSGSVFIGPASP